MNAAQLSKATGASLALATDWLPEIDLAMCAYGIDTPARQAAFLAQVGHESGGLQWVTELWGPTIAQRGYEGRVDLGNTHPGDGFRFRGHGLIQITGRANHARVRNRLQARFPEMNVPDFEIVPDALAIHRWAALSAADFWDEHGLSALADVGDFGAITRRINGGLNGQAQRMALLSSALEALA